MKVYIDSDELYPFYYLAEWGDECEVPDEVAERWRSVIADFREVQEEMRRHYHAEGES